MEHKKNGKMKKHRFCSWCFKKTDHRLKEEHMIGRDMYECLNCFGNVCECISCEGNYELKLLKVEKFSIKSLFNSLLLIFITDIMTLFISYGKLI